MSLAEANALVADAWLLGTFVGMGIRPYGKRAYNRSHAQEVTMPAKFCLDCRELTTNGSRCEACQGALTARLNARPKPNTTRRGLGHAHRVKAKAVVASAQVCARCNRPPTSGNPLTAHHTVARAKGGADSPMVALCRSCNSKIGDRT